MSGNGEAPLDLAAAKKTGRDLMPMIVIFVFGIIMTVVAISVFNLLKSDPEKEEIRLQQENWRRQNEVFDLMKQGSHAMGQKKYAAALRSFEKTALLLEGQDHPVLLFELNLKLARAEAALGNRQRAERYVKNAERYRLMVQQYLNSELKKAHGEMKKQTGEQKK